MPGQRQLGADGRHRPGQEWQREKCQRRAVHELDPPVLVKQVDHVDQRNDQQRADRHHREGQVNLHEIQDPQRQRVLFNDVEQERQAEYRGYRAQLGPIARRRKAGAGIDHHKDEHGGERRDRGVGDGSGGEPLQQKHEQRKHHQEMEQVREWPAPCARESRVSWSWLRVAASSSSAASSRAPKRSECRVTRREIR